MLEVGRCHALVLLVVAVLLAPEAAQSELRQEHLRVIQDRPLEKHYQKMMPEFLLRLAQQATEKRLARLENLKSEADVKNWQETNRQKFLELIGGLPAERTPLNPRVVGELERDGYVVRKLIFESLPAFYVTATLYVPTTDKPPFPAVLAPVGHSKNGKAYDVYQHLFIGLAKRGYVVLAYDPQGQGERLQYWDLINHRRSFEFNQHAMAGLQEYLLGQNLARYFIWDGFRALDYLTSLPEVDASRIGCTGNSGGGTLTTYISMLDSRVKVSSIVTFISSIPKKIESRDLDAESDPEQDIAGLLAAGIDHAEMVGLIAPRPVLIGAATRDFFPIDGTRQTFGELQSLYKKLGIPERVKMVEFDHGHMYSQPLREATTAWFDRWLKGKQEEVHEPEIVVEEDAALECTPTGQVVTSLGGRRVVDFNRAEADCRLRQLEARRRDPAFERMLPEKIRERLALPRVALVPRAQKLDELEIAGLVVEKLLIETEPGIKITARVIYPRAHRARLPAVVYLRDRLGEKDLPTIFESLAREGRLVAVVDVRGFGETWSARATGKTHASYFDPRDGVDADFAYAAFFLGRPLLGMRVWDALNADEFVRSRPDVDASRIAIAGRGWAGLIALFAAATDGKIASIALDGIPASYGEVAGAELYNLPASQLLPGVLEDFDLADVLVSLAPRPLLLLSPTDAQLRKMYQEETEAAFRSVLEAYEAWPFTIGLSIRVLAFEEDIPRELVRWVLDH